MVFLASASPPSQSLLLPPAQPARPPRLRRSHNASSSSHTALGALAAIAGVARARPSPPTATPHDWLSTGARLPAVTSAHPVVPLARTRRPPASARTPAPGERPLLPLVRRRDDTAAAATTSATATCSFPDYYSKAEDGYWHKQPCYQDMSISVKAACDACTACNANPSNGFPDSSTSGSPVRPNDATITDVSMEDMDPKTTIDPNAFDQVPRGWPRDKLTRNSQETKMIATVSIALACVILGFMLSALYVRSRARRRADPDLEHVRRKEFADSASMLHSGTPSKPALLKLPARWKTSLTHAVRRRRKRRTAYDLDQPRGRTAHSTALRTSRSASPSRSRSLSPPPGSPFGSATLSVSDDSEVSDTPVALLAALPACPAVEPSARAGSPPPPFVPPPAFEDTRTQAAPHWDPASAHATSAPNPLAGPSRPPYPDKHAVAVYEDEHEPAYAAPSPAAAGAAHVATDDKAALAELSALASAPARASSQADGPAPVAPDWQDEPLPPSVLCGDDLGADGSEAGALPRAESPAPGLDAAGSVSLARSPFPPLPPKARMAAPAFESYSGAFDAAGDGADSDADGMPLGPSAPPFSPSAPPGDDLLLGASAPPFAPSVPPADGPEGSSVGPSAPACDATLAPSAPPLFEGDDEDGLHALAPRPPPVYNS